MQIDRVESPNFNARRQALDMLVLHYTGMETGEAALQRMCDPAAEVSAHYMVWEDGRITQLVEEDQRAWHAGVSFWQDDDDLNSRSIGIEIVNGGHDVPLPDGRLPPYPDPQIAAVIALSKDILSRHIIRPSRIVGHSDIAPARKIDPGEHFPWAQLAAEGIGYWPALPAMSGRDGGSLLPGDTGKHVERLQDTLKGIGYELAVDGIYSDETASIVRAFQRRWLPMRLTGHAGAGTLARIAQIHAGLEASSGSLTS
ncbi:hypothetical protein HY29_12705 [Hyphomonas beringensis]|uniref:N-acetylmuramoyl-L-alanine amidase n=1 Tax=Hyphomonas beringensis TaxID=1280946 RepID=A0A062UGY7_9PROT|nr:N-acetylmuramoyl-L-alanine amidase [Hyphomonas beringensis]KCZ55390.1 hypothetical protein HY29_12705 [Hyphomonas beringensis]